jgi:hypothetical protein
MLTPKQSDAVASSSIPLKDRKNLLWHIQCHACKSYLRLKWGRLLLLSCLAALALLAGSAFIKIPGFHNLPAALVVIFSSCLAISFQAINRRLPLERNR